MHLNVGNKLLCCLAAAKEKHFDKFIEFYEPPACLTMIATKRKTTAINIPYLQVINLTEYSTAAAIPSSPLRGNYLLPYSLTFVFLQELLS